MIDLACVGGYFKVNKDGGSHHLGPIKNWLGLFDPIFFIDNNKKIYINHWFTFFILFFNLLSRTLHRIHGLLHALRSSEIDLLEKILINKETDLSGLSIPQSEEWNQIDESNAENHRRYSDPGVSDCRNDSELLQEKENLIDLNQKCSPSFSRIFSLNDCSKDHDLDDCSQKLNNDDSMSISSNATTITNSTVDSFEIALALCAKHSNYVSDGSKQLLHNLFVSIAGKHKALSKSFYGICQNLDNL